MFKWILLSTLIFGGLGLFLSQTSYIPLEKQINVKTMQASKIQYITSMRSECVGDCTDYSSDNNSYGGSSYGGK